MLEDLTFELTSTGETIYDPETITSVTPLNFTVRNLGIEDLTDLGIFVVPSTTVGDVDFPADFPPETDYQDLIRWGEESEEGVAVSGGLLLTVPQNTGPNLVNYVTRQAGSTLANKLPMKDLPANSSLDLVVAIETPPAVTARRVYISLRIDTDV